MNPADAGSLLDMARGIWPAMPVQPTTGEAWAEALARVGFDHARRAVLDVAQNSDAPPTIAKICAVARHHASVAALVERASGATATRKGEKAPVRCRRESCRCTHTEGCEAGWIEAEPSVELTAKGVPMYDRVRPCPTCKPEFVAHMEGANDRLPTLAAWREKGSGKATWTGTP